MTEQCGRNYNSGISERNTNKNKANSPHRTSEKFITLKASETMEGEVRYRDENQAETLYTNQAESQDSSQLCALQLPTFYSI